MQSTAKPQSNFDLQLNLCSQAYVVIQAKYLRSIGFNSLHVNKNYSSTRLPLKN